MVRNLCGSRIIKERSRECCKTSSRLTLCQKHVLSFSFIVCTTFEDRRILIEGRLRKKKKERKKRDKERRKKKKRKIKVNSLLTCFVAISKEKKREKNRMERRKIIVVHIQGEWIIFTFSNIISNFGFMGKKKNAKDKVTLFEKIHLTMESIFS